MGHSDSLDRKKIKSARASPKFELQTEFRTDPGQKVWPQGGPRLGGLALIWN